MTDSIQEILDLMAWIVGGLLFGLLVLGGYSFYQAYTNPSFPKISVQPINENKIDPKNTRKTFRPPEEFHLVQKLSEPENKSTGNEETQQDQKENQPSKASSEKTVSVTELPLKLLGTTTGFSSYETAVVRHLRERKTRTLVVNEQWQDIKIVKITDNYIEFINQRNNRRERLKLSDSDS
jgi:hypothetical protein